MKVETPQIAWHFEVENTTCIDFHPTLPLLAVGGSDSTGQNVYLRLWQLDLKLLEENSGTADIKKENVLESIFKLECQLDRGHNSTINAVNFSPCGLFIASGGDDNKVVIWTEKIKPKEFGSSELIKTWGDQKELSGHGKEVYDVRWFADSKHLVSASLDFRAVIWDVESGSIVQQLEGHNNYVKGCAVDPTGFHLMTQSTDRTIKIFKTVKQKKYQFICKAVDPAHPERQEDEVPAARLGQSRGHHGHRAARRRLLQALPRREHGRNVRPAHTGFSADPTGHLTGAAFWFRHRSTS